jgi:hypothetical protein
MDEQIETWEALFEKIRECLSEFGREDFAGRADYWVLDDNYGFKSINVAINRLAFLQPRIVHRLQGLLKNYPDWEIRIAIDVPGKEETWPEMGIVVRSSEVVDRLQRSYLPGEYRDLAFGKSKDR